MVRAKFFAHRRFMLGHGSVGFSRCLGFSDRWSAHAQDENHWRDTHARVEGPVVAQLQSAFQGHWIKTFGEALSGSGQFPALPSVGDLKAQIVESRSFS